uniref:Acyl-coenzyme A thioesterase 13 n=2 Tax=Aegilops tauschii subsp. strangulata TaxID=200361 RepID=A0A453C0J5_AEGTS
KALPLPANHARTPQVSNHIVFVLRAPPNPRNSFPDPAATTTSSPAPAPPPRHGPGGGAEDPRAHRFRRGHLGLHPLRLLRHQRRPPRGRRARPRPLLLRRHPPYRRKPRAPSPPKPRELAPLLLRFRHADVTARGVWFELGIDLQSPQGYLLSGVTATLADQLGSAVFFSSGVGTSGVSLEISVSYVDTAAVGEEIEVEAKLLRAGKSVGVVSVDFRKKRSGKLMAQARHTKYLAVSSRL